MISCQTLIVMIANIVHNTNKYLYTLMLIIKLYFINE
jgi:hypothetical protein